MRRTSDVPSFATKISPSVLSFASSTSTLVTPSRRPFVQETGFTALFDHWMPFAGVLITKYAAQALSNSPYAAQAGLNSHVAFVNGSRYHAKKRVRRPVGM